jgi:autoinducer 2 (AI-2) kinase
MKYLMAIDAGTGSVRAVIFDENAKQISVVAQEWTHKEDVGVKNSMSFDYLKNWDIICDCIKGAITKAKIDSKNILAISASSMREGIVAYDKNNKEVFAVANVDSRASKEVKYINKKFPKLQEKFYKKSGQTFALGALPRLMWLKNNRFKIYEKVTNMSMISDWVLYKLSGIIASDPSNGGTSGVFSLKSRKYVSKMAKKIGIKDDIFPKVLEAGEVMGFVQLSVTKQTGLSSKTKIVMGGGDVQLGSVGLGVVKENEVAILGGSFWQQIVNIKKDMKPPKDMSLRVNPHIISNLSQAEGISFFSGLIIRWFRDVFANEEIKQAKKENKDVYQILEEKASKVPVGSYGIIPIFSDTMKYKKWYHASPSLLNLSIDKDKCNKASIFRALQENACIVSTINLQKIQKWTNNKINTIVFAGGASKGDLFCQILADVSGCKVKVPKVIEATSLGCAIVAGVGAGIYTDISKDAKRLVKWDKEYIPIKENTNKYKKIQKKWKKAYKVQLKLVNDNITKAMWKAPGL